MRHLFSVLLAREIGVDDTRGTVAVGQVADLLIVDANPVADIRNTRRIRCVIKDGRIVHGAAEGALSARESRAAVLGARCCELGTSAHTRGVVDGTVIL